MRSGLKRQFAITREPVRRENGVALAIVLWFVAGMSLLVAAIVSQARIDTQMAQLHLARSKVVAAGDGAMMLMLAEQGQGIHSEPAGPGQLRGDYRVGDIAVTVLLYPVAGLIDINAADEQLLAALFLSAGDLTQQEADELALNVVKWRTGVTGPGSTRARPNRFQTYEDLLRVTGIQRTLLDSVRDYVVAGQIGAGAINWSIAPDGLMPVLAVNDPGRLDSVTRRREALGQNAQNQGGGPLSGGLRADALVSYGGVTWLRRRWILPGESDASVMPWRVVRTEPPRVYQG